MLLIHILRANSVVYWGYWGAEFDLTAYFHCDDYFIYQKILQSKSTKLVDRLFAILPHTKYKDAAQKLVDEEIAIDDEEDLKRLLFDILGGKGSTLVLLRVLDKEFRLEEDLPHNDNNSSMDKFEVQEITTEGKYGVAKVLLPVIDLLPYDTNQPYDINQLLDSDSGLEIQVVYGYDEHSKFFSYFVCRKSFMAWENACEITSWDGLCDRRTPCKFGEFLMYH
ncbi:hypothetical protein EC973_005785 [Apophysomyces ossiformis]|uniref:Uncharacterized protein n=1 Tax=Apophysomyces ossiformis TaxID=679940 RepID=A0A8H7BDM9_9FUNG|nr:hypothetical protein EC973_005785 [Apophysomyces ossiformis]